MENQGRFQTRNEEGALTFEETFEAALNKAKEDPTIWKISWTDEGGERIRLVKIVSVQKGTNAEAILWVSEPLLQDVNINDTDHIRRIVPPEVREAVESRMNSELLEGGEEK